MHFIFKFRIHIKTLHLQISRLYYVKNFVLKDRRVTMLR